jgi:CheY-like chemotaxis protein
VNNPSSIETGEDADASARVLVVDDNGINRKKMRMAVEHLGHLTGVAEDGVKALEALRSERYDAVLLDILMPEMDGFEVLAHMKADSQMRDVPVIVISALDDETETVVRALELGAEDFLPKNFDPVVLKARLGASLSKKRFRDQEREYFGRIERLTEAAEVLESGRFNPDSLDLDDLASHSDPVGRLAAVFRGMATEIYQRELKLKRAVQTLQGSFLVIAVGLVWGLTPALSRMASGLGLNALGLAVWVNGIAAVFCLMIAAYRGTPSSARAARDWVFLHLGNPCRHPATYDDFRRDRACRSCDAIADRDASGFYGFWIRGNHQDGNGLSPTPPRPRCGPSGRFLRDVYPVRYGGHYPEFLAFVRNVASASLRRRSHRPCQ